jgi:carbon-monoxide dehydrogenase small subunit
VAEITCRVNGTVRTVEAAPMARLLDVLREDLGLTGTKEGCGEGECGACCVRMDGRLVNTCLVPALEAADRELLTVEGLAADDATLASVQRAFVDHGGAQCGICTPGMLLAAHDLLDRKPDPSEAEVREHLAGNLCRCTGYFKIFDAVLAAARLQRSRNGRASTQPAGSEPRSGR